MKVLTLPDGQDQVAVWPANGTAAVILQAEAMDPSGGVATVQAGIGIAVDDTDPANPVVSNTGVLDVAAGTGIAIGGTAQHPSVANTGVLGVTAGSGITVGGTAQNPSIAANVSIAWLRLLNVDLIIPTSGGNDKFVRVTAAASDFTLVNDAASSFTKGSNGTLTYAGATRNALVSAAVTVEIGNFPRTTIPLCIDLNGDTIGQASFSVAALAAGQIQTTTDTTINVFEDLPISTQRLVTLHNGDVLSCTYAANTGTTATDMALEGHSLSIVLL